MCTLYSGVLFENMNYATSDKEEKVEEYRVYQASSK